LPCDIIRGQPCIAAVDPHGRGEENLRQARHQDNPAQGSRALKELQCMGEGGSSAYLVMEKGSRVGIGVGFGIWDLGFGM
jgi:hypothetical protein